MAPTLTMFEQVEAQVTITCPLAWDAIAASRQDPHSVALLAAADQAMAAFNEADERWATVQLEGFVLGDGITVRQEREVMEDGSVSYVWWVISENYLTNALRRQLEPYMASPSGLRWSYSTASAEPG